MRLFCEFQDCINGWIVSTYDRASAHGDPNSVIVYVAKTKAECMELVERVFDEAYQELQP